MPAASHHERGSREPIRHRALLVTEGRDAFRFLLAFLRELKLDGAVEVRDAGGVSDLPSYLKALRSVEGFHQVVALAVVRDSETSPNGALRSVMSGLQNAGFAAPSAAATFANGNPATAIFLLPDATTAGMLETLCWRSIAGHPAVPCVDDFLSCVERAAGSPVANPDKSRVFAYIAAREKPSMLLGQSADAGYFPWDAPAFDELKAFLRALAATGAP